VVFFIPIIIVGCHGEVFESSNGGMFDCRMDNYNLVKCSNQKQTPVRDWSSFRNTSKFNLQTVKRLELKNNRIQSFKKGAFTNFTSVIRINLENNQLNEIDFSEFRNNSELTYLDVGNNQISDIKPIHSSTVISIINLLLYNNNLTDISELCKIRNLKWLDLSHNQRINFSNVVFNCWKELSNLNLAETNLKTLNHDYRMLTGCNQLNYLNLMDNNLKILCFERFPYLPKLKQLNIRNNSLISLDVLKLTEKLSFLVKITATVNSWTCSYYSNILKNELANSNITEFIPTTDKEQTCVNTSVEPVDRYCPKVGHKDHRNSDLSLVIFWILNFVFLITIETLQMVLFYYSLN
jgi:Leucine-rich repeat (LRR) protein